MVETPTPSASFAAGPGSSARGTPAPRAAIGTTRMSATTTLAFGAPEFRHKASQEEAAAGLALGRPKAERRGAMGRECRRGGGQDHQGPPQGS